MGTRKCTIRYGTSLVPMFAKNIDVVPPKYEELKSAEIIPKSRISELSSSSKLRRPSISAILGSIDDKKALFLWQKQMIDEMGMAGFRKTMTDRLQIGIKVHSRVEEMLKISRSQDFQESKLISIIDSEKDVLLAKYLRSAFPIILDFKNAKSVITEKAVRHPLLAYQGRFDAVIEHKGQLNILDWKTAQVQSSFSKQGEESISYINYVRQLAAYASAFNYDNKFETHPNVESGLLVSLKEDGSPADVFQISENELKTSFEDIKEKIRRFWTSIEESDGPNIDFAYKPPPAD